jgi:hypothetical protein
MVFLNKSFSSKSFSFETNPYYTNNTRKKEHILFHCPKKTRPCQLEHLTKSRLNLVYKTFVHEVFYKFLNAWRAAWSPKTTVSAIELPPIRLFPCNPPATSPPAYNPLMGTKFLFKTSAFGDVLSPPIV